LAARRARGIDDLRGAVSEPNKACVAASAQLPIARIRADRSACASVRNTFSYPPTALKDADVSEDLQVTGHAWLALAKDLGKLTYRQLHQPQERYDAQPGWIGKRLESIGER
jgi:hypothetical protein